MSKQTDIPHVNEIEDVGVSAPIEPFVEQMRAKGTKNPIIYHGRRKDSALKRIFNAAKNTITAKNNTGRVLRGVGIAAVGIVTGINLEPLIQPTPEALMEDFFTDINFWAIISFLFGLFATWAKTKSGEKLDAVIDDADTGLEMYALFKSQESEEGERLSPNEQSQLIEFLASQFKAQKRKAAKSG